MSDTAMVVSAYPGITDGLNGIAKFCTWRWSGSSVSSSPSSALNRPGGAFACGSSIH